MKRKNMQGRIKNINVDGSFLNWMREQRKQFEKETGIPMQSDLKFSAVLVKGKMLKIRIPKRGGFNVRF